MVRENLHALTKSLDIAFEQINITSFKEMPSADALTAACAEVPLMSPMRLVIVRDGSILYAKNTTREAKRIAAFLPDLPDTTALVFCSDEAPDKRRALYKKIKEMGQVKEFSAPRHADCVRFAAQQAKCRGTSISRSAADALVSKAGCDYYTLDNEIAKLAVYADGETITAEHVTACASRSLEYNVFEMHTLLVSGKAAQARRLLDDVMKEERPEALVGIFARKIRDLYKTRAMKDAGFGHDRIAAQLKLPGFVTSKLIEECRSFTQQELRSGLITLAELDYTVKSGQKDASLALPDALVKIYKL